ncbi:MAG: peptidase U32 [uncultured bacterium (gcode 4)]|uniref:Peptidase U32 n=1 Tax=uncultured bacterium (gcode 4) TaxID=1234023 RepID=K1XK96_9BACT|nr:MAG: peptidase U32 [uncultured bacterium (gcode 4)]
MKISIATNWDDDLVDYISKSNNDCLSNSICEFFASKAFSILWSANTDVPDLSLQDIKQKISYIKDKNIQFNYLINSSKMPDLNDEIIRKKVLDYLSWINTLGIDILTVASEDLLDLIYKNFPNIPINISVVLWLKTIEKANYLREKYPNIVRLTLHQDINRDKKLLEEHIKNAHNHQTLKPVEIELLANEVCFIGCWLMKDHYDALTSLSQKKTWKDFMFWWCCAKRKENIIDFINSSFIRPEDMILYEDLWVDIIKLAWRKEQTNELKLRAKAYLEGYYDWNIMDLFLAEFWPMKKPPYISNSSFNWFVKFLWGQKLIKIDNKEIFPWFKNLDYNRN